MLLMLDVRSLNILLVAALETAYTAAIRTEDEPPFLQDVKVGVTQC